MQHLDDCAEADARVRFAAKRARSQQKQQRSKPLSASADKVSCDVRDDRNLRVGLAGELALDGGEIATRRRSKTSAALAMEIELTLH